MEGYWNDEDKLITVEILKEENNTYCGRIIWMKNPLNDQGEPDIDEHNPDPTLKNRPLLGMPLMHSFKHKRGGKYEGGRIYNPQDGKTYKAKINVKGDIMKLRGYIGIPTLGMTTIWTRSESIEAM